MNEQHWCNRTSDFPLGKFHQQGQGRGEKVLILGESPAPNGWIIPGRACYTPEGKLLPTGKRLNELLQLLDLSIEICGFTELSKCFVGKNRNQLEKCGIKCWPILVSQLEKSHYKIIIVLGVQTLKIFNKIVKLELKVGQIQEILIGDKKYNILPIYHPFPVNPHGRGLNKVIFESELPILKKVLAI